MALTVGNCGVPYLPEDVHDAMCTKPIRGELRHVSEAALCGSDDYEGVNVGEAHAEVLAAGVHVEGTYTPTAELGERPP